jgi:hypothetical protein
MPPDMPPRNRTAPASHTTLTRGALNRATLARQMLLQREAVKPVTAVERLAGLQAQAARPPFVGLWSRLDGFRREDLVRAIECQQVVRGTLMRGTLHLVTRTDYVRFRRTLQPMLTAGLRAILRGRMESLDVAGAVAEARAWFDEAPRTFDQLRARLERRFAGADVRGLAYAVRMELPLLQVPAPDERWAYAARADFAVAETWLGASLTPRDDSQGLVLRYLEAFGPASVADAQTWCGLGGLVDVFEQLRPKLCTFQDERGRELFDLPHAPRPDADQDAPVRFLPEWDNLLLSHADRSRVIADAHRPAITTANLRLPGTFLVDGFVAGTWVASRRKKAATLELRPFSPLSRSARTALEEEGESLVRFMEPDATTFSMIPGVRA